MKTLADLKACCADIAKAAQDEYDQWDESNVDTYAGGGICHFIAERIVEVLDKHGIEGQTVSSSYEVHVYAVTAVKEGVFVVDVPYGIYEKGGGYSWKKLPDITFDASDVSISRVDSDPEEIGKYLDENTGPKAFRTFLAEAEKKKVSKATAHYEDQSGVNFPKKRCELCTMFRLHPPDFESGACTTVEGLIDANGICDYFKRDPKAKDLAEGVRGTRPLILKSRQFREAYGRNSALNWNIAPGARKDAEGVVTYHKDIGLPQSYTMPKGLTLKYGQHSLDRAREKGITLPRTLPPVYQVIEVEMNGRRVTKWVVRFNVSPTDDAVMAILPDGTVKTAWLNDKNDLHNTLDKSKYAAKPNF